MRTFRDAFVFTSFNSVFVLNRVQIGAEGNEIISRKETRMNRSLVAVLIMLALTVAVDAQRQGGPPPGGGMGMGQPPDPASALKAALNLTDAQVVSVQTLLQTRQQRAQTIQAEIEEKRLAFEAALNAPSPNATTVGNAAIALRASENKMVAERDWFLAELKKLLTADQQATLDNLIKAGTAIPGLFGGMRGRGGPRGSEGDKGKWSMFNGQLSVVI